MAEKERQRFPRWWQALILIVAGFLIFFSSCAGAFSSGFGGHPSPYGQNLYGAGMLIGAGTFLLGVVAAIAVFVMAIVRAFRWQQAPFDSLTGAPLRSAAPLAGSQTGAAAQDERQILWNLRIAIIVVMVVGSGWLQILPLLGRYLTTARPHLLTYFLVTYLLTEVPYIVALIRTARGPDRPGIAIAFAAGGVELLLWLWQSFSRPHFYSQLVLQILAPIAEVAVIAFAWRAGRLRQPEKSDLEIVVFCCVGVAAYIITLRFWLPYLQQILMG